MNLKEEQIIQETIKEVFDKYNFVPETLADFNEIEQLLRLFKKWNEYI